MKKISEKLVCYIIWGAIILLALSIFRNFERSSRIKTQIEAEKTKLTKIQAENDRLSKELAQTQNPNFIEREVRNKLGLGKENEAIVVLPDEEILRKLAPEERVEEDILPDPNWKKWEKLFF